MEGIEKYMCYLRNLRGSYGIYKITDHNTHCSILHEFFDIQISLSILTFAIDVLVFNVSSVLTDDKKSKK